MRVDGEIIKLTRTEYDILKLLMDNPGRLFSPKELYEKVWNEQSFGNEGTVAVHIRHLREKIEICVMICLHIWKACRLSILTLMPMEISCLFTQMI